MDIGRLVEWIKLSPRYLLPLSLFTGFVLFAPQRWLAVFGIARLVSDYRPWFGVGLPALDDSTPRAQIDFRFAGADMLEVGSSPAYRRIFP
jgi:hypothetical protein